jgi:hypothetical protein
VHWVVAISAERYEAERLFHHDTLELTGLDTAPRPGDHVLVAAPGEPPVAVASGLVVGPEPGAPDPDDPASDPADGGPVVVAYRRRSFDDPAADDRLDLSRPVTPLAEDVYAAIESRLAPPRDDTMWLVSLDLPIEAPTAAEAARQFWSYVMDLGPRELPIFVAPKDDELSMTPYVLGAETNLDPEEDDA